MKFALYLIALTGNVYEPGVPQSHAWALDGNMTLAECETRKAELAPAYALMGPNASLECDRDHSPEAWDS